jgi:hypothetical protein
VQSRTALPASAFARRATALGLLLFLATSNVAYALLIRDFGYDDILRQPPGEVLALFQQRRQVLIVEWLGFAAAALMFLPIAWALPALLGARSAFVAVSGSLAALVQCSALLRWPFLVPALAEAWSTGDSAIQAQAEQLFIYSNQFLGVALGELLGQWLLVVWTAGVSLLLWQRGGSARTLAWAGLLILPLWLTGHSELINMVLPDVPVWETTPLAFILWQLWLFTLIPWLWLTSTASTGTTDPRP